MEEILLNIFFWGVFVGGGTIFIIFSIVMAVKQYKRDAAKKETETDQKTPDEQTYATITTTATVIDQSCCVKTIGIKIPKTVKEFVVIFRTETGEILRLNVPEEMYDGFEKGQVGILTIVDGDLYSFVMEDI